MKSTLMGDWNTVVVSPSFSKCLPIQSTHFPPLCVHNIISKIRGLSQVVSEFLSINMMGLIYICKDLFAIITQYKCQQKHGEIMRILINLGHFEANWYQLLPIFWRMRLYALGWMVGIPSFYCRNMLNRCFKTITLLTF